MCTNDNALQSEYLQAQLITYIGNKRSLLPFIGQAVGLVQKELKKEKLCCLDLFSGSGVVARYLKQYSSFLAVNDLENYSCVINRCYLANQDEKSTKQLRQVYDRLVKKIDEKMNELERARADNSYTPPGFISQLYAPLDMDNIKKQDRCFYTPYNAAYIDVARQLIETEVPKKLRDFFIAPLLSEASIHANTSGVFKGFYKNSGTGKGQFGGNGKNALNRILGKISLPFPVFSESSCPFQVFNSEANELVASKEFKELPQFDLVYLDPPYNQHPYGSNYFMLNLIAGYTQPDLQSISRVSGIPKDWKRSYYNKKRYAADSFYELVNAINSKYILVSFNSEGFIPKDQMIQLLSKCGKVQVLESNYNTFRGSRNLSGRELYVKEYLFLVRKY